MSYPSNNHYPHQQPPYPGQPYFDPQAPYGYDPVTGLPFSDKSKAVAGVLGILLGAIGVGRFYTGHIGLGITQLFLTFFTFGIAGLWGPIEGVVRLLTNPRDANGRPLR